MSLLRKKRRYSSSSENLLFETQSLNDERVRRKVGLTLPFKYKATAASSIIRQRQRAKQWITFSTDEGFPRIIPPAPLLNANKENISANERFNFTGSNNKNIDIETAAKLPTASYQSDNLEFDSEDDEFSTDLRGIGRRRGRRRRYGRNGDEDDDEQKFRLLAVLIMIPAIGFMTYMNRKTDSGGMSGDTFAALAAHGFPGFGGGGGGYRNDYRSSLDHELMEERYRRERNRYREIEEQTSNDDDDDNDKLDDNDIDDEEENYYRENYHHRTRRKLSSRRGRTAKNDKRGYKIILFWNSAAITDNRLTVGTKNFDDSRCAKNRCVITADRNYLLIADAVVFTINDNLTELTTIKRKLNQKWIFLNLTPFQLTLQQQQQIANVNDTANQSDKFEKLSSLNNLINWSWTYSIDSDIIYRGWDYRSINVAKSILTNPLGSGGDRAGKGNVIASKFDIWRRKKRLAVFIDNECETNSEREQLIIELKKTIEIDVIGACGAKICDHNSVDCYRTLERDYLFVLIFESFICADYYSAAVFKALQANIVPVTLGAVNYTKIVPPNSIINARDFTSVAALARFLLNIGSEFEKYKLYFKWKTANEIYESRDDLCELCARLNSIENENLLAAKPYADLAQWWRRRNLCNTWKDFLTV